MNLEAAAGGFLEQPRRLPEGQAVEDQNRLARGGAVPEVDQRRGGARSVLFEVAPEFPGGAGEEQLKVGDVAFPLGELAFDVLDGERG